MAQALKISPALPQACSMCPWRIENHGKPPEECEPGSEPVFYTPERRQAMWQHFGPNGESLGDGIPMFCHKTAPQEAVGQIRSDRALTGKIHRCAGDALQHRAALRAWRSSELGPLKSWNAVRRIVADMLGVEPPTSIQNTEHGWILHGKRITFEQVAAAAHPAVFDPGIGSEQVPPPTAEETAAWSR